MKKYLLFLLTVLAFVSCNKVQEGMSESEYNDFMLSRCFETVFNVDAKSIPSNQEWGIDKMPLFDLTKPSTRAAQPNGNQWGTTDDNSKYIDYPAPAAITDAEREKVLAVFNEKGAVSYEPLVHWKNFFVQQVYTGPNGSKMNELATTVDYQVNTTVISWWPYQATTEVVSVTPFDDIINNFNAGDCTAWDGCMLMWNSATEDFSFKTSQGGGQRWYKHWRMEKINGNYYVGFDHESAKQGSDANNNELDVRDYIYNDWIVKIVPGKDEIIPNTVDYVRVMAEDLGNNAGTDFDYNDIVFDVKFSKIAENKYKANIVLLAAGGTLPLTIAGFEIHQLFGEEASERYPMINTYSGKHAEREVVKLDVELTGNFSTAYDAINALDVKVKGKNIPLTVKKGKPSEMIVVPTGTDWANERQPIGDKYTKFEEWIKDPSVVWWE